ncbi:MAG: undecaprenyl/decaprenyl-phosphate alpha-N-acetylglucosaminyl 1-phosphate transferase [Caldilineales bacterium]|nr:undecaprenyl/decaprenyl-phosphate alpha-N-acetylglucosaminyl 1-phosphate transferase [Caldilineales bacterium]
MILWLSPILAFLLALALTPASMSLGRRWGLVDRPGGRRQHEGVIPRIGGLGMALAFIGSLLLIRSLPDAWLPASLDPNEAKRLTGLLLGCAFVAGFGLLDDRYEFGSGPQYLAQILAAVISIFFIIFIERINNPFGGGQIVFPDPIVWILTIAWFMGAMNTVNWLDGIDGLASSVAAIVAVVLAVHMLRTGQYSVAVLALALLGCTAGFLAFNWPPAKVFMGSVGAYFLGYTLAALGLIAGARVATVLLVMGLPILDVAWLIWQRRRQGKPVGQGDRNHLHYRLLDKGYSQRQIVIAYASFCALFGFISLMTASTPVKLAALLALLVLGGFVIWWASPREKQPVDGKPLNK